MSLSLPFPVVKDDIFVPVEHHMVPFLFFFLFMILCVESWQLWMLNKLIFKNIGMLATGVWNMFKEMVRIEKS